MTKSALPCFLAAALLLSACESLRDKPGETLGAFIGLTAGAILGSRIGDGNGQAIAGAIGAVTGAWLGSSIGKKLDERDEQLAEANARDTLENGATGETGAWSNPDSGNAGAMRPTTDRSADSGEDCREFESSVVVDDETEIATGKACRQPDGSWLIVQ